MCMIEIAITTRPLEESSPPPSRTYTSRTPQIRQSSRDFELQCHISSEASSGRPAEAALFRQSLFVIRNLGSIAEWLAQSTTSMTPSPHMNHVFREGANAAITTGSKRLYQVWKGSNRFFLGGRLVFGPDVRSLFLTLFLIVAPVVVFCVFVGQPLMKHFSNGGFAIIVVAVAHTVIVLVLLLLTSGRDPGIIPRNAHPPEPEEDAGSSSDWSGGQTPKLRLPRTKDVIVNGVVVKIKYCDTCMLYRPPRCSHCSICNNCVDRFDHHCPWVGQCIGRRNYPYFFGFVITTTLLCFYIFAMCALRIKTLMDGDPSVWRALQKSPASGFLMAYAFLATWFVGGLTAFHLYLMSTNQTTYENFRYRYDKKINPYSRSVLKNIQEILCSSIPPSKVNFRAQASADVPGFGNLRSQQRARDDMGAMGLKSGKPRGDVEMGEKSWMAHPVKGMEEVSGSFYKNEVVIEEGRHGFEDSFPEDFSKSLSHEHQAAKNSAYSRGGRQSGNWDFSPELLGFTAGNGGQGIQDQGNK
ncbi:hypothetical protein GOP47_0005330 [Adiantum capillus-veneris]|uniref:S-acyltransferase n=1 Tax=Adiantum capillus-veneris TaxID=13818 RepID=A0A9D4V5T0_ADICA|nr:hypothetical protein GOP47_0005330 [Adiantum capillus-veneris]